MLCHVQPYVPRLRRKVKDVPLRIVSREDGLDEVLIRVVDASVAVAGISDGAGCPRERDAPVVVDDEVVRASPCRGAALRAVGCLDVFSLKYRLYFKRDVGLLAQLLAETVYQRNRVVAAEWHVLYGSKHVDHCGHLGVGEGEPDVLRTGRDGDVAGKAAGAFARQRGEEVGRLVIEARVGEPVAERDHAGRHGNGAAVQLDVVRHAARRSLRRVYSAVRLEVARVHRSERMVCRDVGADVLSLHVRISAADARRSFVAFRPFERRLLLRREVVPR